MFMKYSAEYHFERGMSGLHFPGTNVNIWTAEMSRKIKYAGKILKASPDKLHATFREPDCSWDVAASLSQHCCYCKVRLLTPIFTGIRRSVLTSICQILFRQICMKNNTNELQKLKYVSYHSTRTRSNFPFGNHRIELFVRQPTRNGIWYFSCLSLKIKTINHVKYLKT